MKVCISSDVSSLFIIQGLNRFVCINEYTSINWQLDGLIKQISGNDLSKIENILFEEISHLILNRKSIDTNTTSVKFNKEMYYLNFRDEYDYDICAKVALYDITKKTNKLRGSIYIYNEAIFENEITAKIIAFLRFNSGATHDKIVHRLMDEKTKKQNNIEREIESELTKLIELGLIDFDLRTKEFVITSRGYMLR